MPRSRAQNIPQLWHGIYKSVMFRQRGGFGGDRTSCAPYNSIFCKRRRDQTDILPASPCENKLAPHNNGARLGRSHPLGPHLTVNDGTLGGSET
jgi:hypothetical protein